MQEDDYKVDMPAPGMDGGGDNSGSASGFSLDDILAEYGQEESRLPQAEEEERGEPIVMRPAGRIVNEASFSSIDELIGQAESPAAREEAAESEIVRIYTPHAEPERPPEDEEAEPTFREENERERPVYDGREYTIKNLVDSDEREKYASRNYPEPELTEEDEDAAEESAGREEKRRRREDARERFLSPVVAMLALIALRRGQRRRADDRSPTVEDEDEDVPEMEPKRAAKLYSGQAQSLRQRAKLSAAVCAVMAYITFAWDSFLPLFGALGNSMRAACITLLIMQLTVMVIGLDILTSGVMAAARARPCFDSLVAAACVLSLLDAVMTASLNTEDYGLPFCAVSAMALCFSIWGSYLTCRGYRSSFRLLAKSDRLLPVAGTRVAGDSALLRYERYTRGFISRSEEADLSEYVYSTLAPLLFALAVVLGLLAGVGSGHSRAVLHCISALMSVSCAFSASICFALPFATAARRMFRAGCAVAGWSGAREIGRSGGVIITDSDIFPPGTVEIENIRILEGAFSAKVIGYTGSVIAASGSGLAQSFSELIRRQGYPISRVENFAPHDGGGMTAMVNGESVYVGSTGFMNLMGIRVPQKLSTKSTVFTAINGSLVGIFTMNYKPTAAVQRSLAALLRSKCRPVFALRDFNITPVMIKKKFRMPTDRLEFPSYTERFELSAACPEESVRPAAVSLRENISSLAELTDVGMRLYTASRAGAAVSAAGSLVGLLVMFMLCRTGAFDSAGAANALLFMLLWVLPTLVISFGLGR